MLLVGGVILYCIIMLLILVIAVVGTWDEWC